MTAPGDIRDSAGVRRALASCSHWWGLFRCDQPAEFTVHNSAIGGVQIAGLGPVCARHAMVAVEDHPEWSLELWTPPTIRVGTGD